MHKNRTIPYSEFRKVGMKLLLDNSSSLGIIMGALFGSLHVVFLIDLLIWIAIIAAEIFGTVGELTRAGSAWMTIPFSSGQGLGELLLLPLKILPLLWRLELFLSILFCIAAVPLRRTYAMQVEKARGWKGGTLLLRRFPSILFAIVFFSLFLILALPKFTGDANSPAYLIPLPSEESALLALLAIASYSAITTLVLTFIWEWGIFQGMLLLHRLMVFGPNKVTIHDIYSKFADRDEIL